MDNHPSLNQPGSDYQHILNQMDQGYILVEVLFDVDDKPVDILYIEANAAANRMTGTELAGKRTTELDPNYERHWFEIFGRVAKTGRAEKHELSANPLGVYYQFHAFKVGDVEERKVGVIYEDVTERRRARMAGEALRRSEEQFRLFVTTSSSIVYKMSADWKQMYAMNGKNLLADTGGPTRDWTEKYIPQEDHPLVWQTIKTAIESKRNFELEHRVIQADGAIGWVLSRAVPVLNADGQIIEWLGAGSDITARKRSQLNQALLAELSLELALIHSADETMQKLCEKIGLFFGVTWTIFSELSEPQETSLATHGWNAEGAPSLRGTYRRSDFLYAAPLTAGHAGELTIVNDTRQDPRVSATAYDALGIRSFILVPLAANGLWRFQLSVIDNKPRLWQQDEIELLQELTARVWARLEKTRAEEALRESEAKYRTLFNSMDEGVVSMEMILDENDHVVDFIYLDHNPAVTRQTGLTSEIIGKKVSILYPGLEKYWLESYERVLKTGQAERNEYYFVTQDSWYDIYSTRSGGADSREIVAVYNNITARKRAEERQAYLLKLTDALRPLANPDRIQLTAMRVLGEHLGITRSQFYEAEANQEYLNSAGGYTDGAAPVTQRVRMDDFGTYIKKAFRAGQTLAVPDVSKDERVSAEELFAYDRLGCRAFVGVPLVKGGRLVAAIGLHHATAREWSPGDLVIAEETAERTWAAIARAKAEEALRFSEHRLQRMVNMPRIGVLTFDYAGKLLTANDAFLEMTGYDREELEKKQLTWRDFTPPEHIEASDQIMEQLRTTGRGGPYEKEYFHKNGTRVWMMFVAADLGDGTIVEYAIDISGLKQAEAALRKSEERLQLAITGASIFTWDINPDTGETTYSSNFNDVIGFEISKTSAENFINIHPDDAHFVLQAIESALKGETPLDVEHRIINPATREEIWVRAQGQLVKKAAGQRSFIGITQNITVRKRAEEVLKDYSARLEKEVADRTHELHENYALVQTIYDTTLIGMAVLQPVRDERHRITDFRLMMVNKKIEQTAGRTDMMGQLYGELFPGIRQMGLFDLMVKTMETGAPGKMEYRYPYEGIDRWYSTVFIKGEDILVSTNLDITERKQAEEERFRDYILLRQSEELAGTGSWDYDLLTGAFIWSDGMYRLFNLQKEVGIRPEIYLRYATAACKETAGRIVRHIENGDAGFDESIELQLGETIKVVKLKATVVKNPDGLPVRVLGVDMDVTATRKAEEKLRQLETEQQLEIFRVILRTQEDERRRISESLHNGLGQMLYGIKISLSQLTVQRATETPGAFEVSRQYTNDLLSDAMRDSRRISHELMPAVLEEFGLKAAVKDICQQMQNGVKFRCSIEVGDTQMDKYMQLAVFRTLQELMINVVKHAQATRAKADIRYHNNQITIRVSDNGKGFDHEKQVQDGIGLASIRSKVDLLKGIVAIKSSPGKGTTVKVALPYKPESAN